MTPWILLRGLTRETRHWGEFPSRLQEFGAPVLALDLPGNGRLCREASPASVEAMADHVRAQLQSQGHAPPYRLLSMSLGAMVAVAWADARPHEIAGAVLINTSLRPFSPFTQRLRPANYTTLLRLALSSDEARWEEAVLRMTTRLAPVGPPRVRLLDDWVAWRRECPVSRTNALRQLLAAGRYRAPAEKPAVPMLVLTSTRDGLVDTRCSECLAAVWQCEIARHPRAGHDLPLDDSAWVLAQIRRWLADHPVTAPDR
jgi:pimeloyl-ACP methyl ester carboxylesterase